MKRTIIFIISIVLIICAILLSKYYSYKEKYNLIQEFNLKYEKYLDKEIEGIDIATIINQAVDDNEKNKYTKDNEEINVEIKITEFQDEKIFTMATLYSGGMSEFVKYYGQIPFKCVQTEYGLNGKIKYMLFEQINL